MSVDGDIDTADRAAHEDATVSIAAGDAAGDFVRQEQASDIQPAGSEPVLSKNAQRRLRKAERQAALKAARKLKDKEKKAEKKRKREEAIASGVQAPEPPRKRPRPPPVEQKKFNARVIVDLGFDDKMSEKEVMSLCNQLSYTYGANRKAPVMFANLAFSSLNGQTQHRMEEAFRGSYKQWKAVDWWPDGYEHLWREPDAAGNENEAHGDAEATLPRAPKGSIVYLTADGDEEITELKEGETYIIGGIVDRNRYKVIITMVLQNLCRDKATGQGIRAARLPIGKYLSELPTRKVLTVNQVIDIMLTWLEIGDWREAFWKQIPKRKFQGKERGDDDAGDEAEVGVPEGDEDGADEDAEEGSDAPLGTVEFGTEPPEPAEPVVPPEEIDKLL
ncbi:hypothetical protein CALCODRAFT_501271 [Calocera cornea HHB12733]|uniref:tRNA (guanine(9)-N1)-methyltransferase n=1 Tax=Calocera cornea HHB12733 TaxID=1353952 RepID=A0A165DQL4_9BASI|nr:hypothetical protein CALCODRAFT_501271 [Calocera cornea HHB12733]